jgi:hypothetical protein
VREEREEKSMRERKHFVNRLAVNLFGFAVLAAIAGCAAGTGARLDRSLQVLNDFRAARVLPDHRYYTTGPQNSPNAILGVSTAYTLISDRWTEREMTPELLRRLVGSMDTEFLSTVSGLLGASVLGPEREQIGVWYSGVGFTTVVMLGDREVRIDPPLNSEIQQLRTPD